jgi:hypothetical protein
MKLLQKRQQLFVKVLLIGNSEPVFMFYSGRSINYLILPKAYTRYFCS